MGVKFSWKDYFDTNFLIEDSKLYLKERYTSDKFDYYLPIPYSGNNQELTLIFEDALRDSGRVHLVNLTLEEAQKLKTLYPHSEYNYDRNRSDYLYLTESFITFSGKALANKRRQLAKFLRVYRDVSFKEATSEDKDEIKKLIKEFAKTKVLSSEESFNEEEEAIKVIDYYEAIGLRCFIVKNGQRIIGVSLVEVIGDVLFDHIEKCLRDYEGVYAYMINMLARTFSDVKYFNREDDSGDIGLRYSKEELNPISMVDKYTLKIKNNLDLLSEIPTIRGEKVTLEKMSEKYKDDYTKMYLDDQLNCYWGYDYRLDLHGNSADSTYFLNMVLDDFKKKDDFVFIVTRDKKLLGEVVLFDLDLENSAAIGFRIIRAEERKGYAHDAVKTTVGYLFKKLKLSKLRTWCYKENLASKKTIEKIGFKYVGEDEKYYRYELINSDLV
jgi:RimJ/RimL family protein N-acetyltransferase